MFPIFVIPFLFVFVLVNSDGQVEAIELTADCCKQSTELETNGIKKIALENIATILEPEFTTDEKSQLSDEKVKIQLYYETHCPYCVDFGSGSFVDVVVDLQSYLDVHVYPYGNAWVDQNGNIACQHGPTECYGNKLHACAIDYLGNITTAVIFNGCMMDEGRRSDDAAADECGKSMDIDSESIKQCAKGPKGEELLKFYGDESRKVHYEGVPTVLINGVESSPDNFRSDVCHSFMYPPPPCDSRR